MMGLCCQLRQLSRKEKIPLQEEVLQIPHIHFKTTGMEDASVKISSIVDCVYGVEFGL
jgi:hypothetical protein